MSMFSDIFVVYGLAGLLALNYFFNKPPVKKKKGWSASLVELIVEFFKNLIKLAMRGPRDMSHFVFYTTPVFMNKIIYYFMFWMLKMIWYFLGLIFLSFYCCFYWSTLCWNNFYFVTKLVLLKFKSLPNKCKDLYLNFTWQNLWSYYWNLSWLTFIQKFRLLVFLYVKSILLMTYIIYFVNYFCYMIYYLFCTFIIYTQCYLSLECLKLKYSTLDMLNFWGIVQDLFKNSQRAYFVFYLEFLTFFENLFFYPQKKKYFLHIFFLKLFKFLQQLKYQLFYQKLKLIQNFIYFDKWIGYYLSLLYNNKNDYF